MSEVVETYMGKKLEDMTKEELIAAVRLLGHQLKYAYEDSIARYNSLTKQKAQS